MKLLFDQNLSPNLVSKLDDIYPGSNHVYLVGLDEAHDEEIWQYAKDNEYVIVSKDGDFSNIGALKGFPPYIIWIKRGNCTTREIENILRRNVDSIQLIETAEYGGVITLF
ncbi:MAG: hypothetical protein GWN62_27045 [Aliifodinibius sp.]|nr:hypothetical protein [Fodinibius sp.]